MLSAVGVKSAVWYVSCFGWCCGDVGEFWWVRWHQAVHADFLFFQNSTIVEVHSSRLPHHFCMTQICNPFFNDSSGDVFALGLLRVQCLAPGSMFQHASFGIAESSAHTLYATCHTALFGSSVMWLTVHAFLPHRVT